MLLATILKALALTAGLVYVATDWEPALLGEFIATHGDLWGNPVGSDGSKADNSVRWWEWRAFLRWCRRCGCPAWVVASWAEFEDITWIALGARWHTRTGLPSGIVITYLFQTWRFLHVVLFCLGRAGVRGSCAAVRGAVAVVTGDDALAFFRDAAVSDRYRSALRRMASYGIPIDVDPGRGPRAVTFIQCIAWEDPQIVRCSNRTALGLLEPAALSGARMGPRVERALGKGNFLQRPLAWITRHLRGLLSGLADRLSNAAAVPFLSSIWARALVLAGIPHRRPVTSGPAWEKNWELMAQLYGGRCPTRCEHTAVLAALGRVRTPIFAVWWPSLAGLLWE